MLIRLKNGDDYLEIDSDVSNDEIDTLEKINNVDSLEDTLEFSKNEFVGDENG